MPSACATAAAAERVLHVVAPGMRSRTGAARLADVQREGDAVEAAVAIARAATSRPRPNSMRRPRKPGGDAHDPLVVHVDRDRRLAARMPANSSPLAAATPAMLPRPSRCAGPTLVITPTSGAAISVRRAISPGAFMPISSTATASSPVRRSSVSGRPIRLFSLPCVFSTPPDGGGTDGALADRRHHLLGRRLAVAAGDGDDARRLAPARVRGEIAERAQRVGDARRRGAGRRRRERARPAPPARRCAAPRRRSRGRRGVRRAGRRRARRAATRRESVLTASNSRRATSAALSAAAVALTTSFRVQTIDDQSRSARRRATS